MGPVPSPTAGQVPRTAQAFGVPDQAKTGEPEPSPLSPAARKALLHECIVPHVADNRNAAPPQTKPVTLDVTGPFEDLQSVRYEISLIGPSLFLSQKSARTWERLRIVIMVTPAAQAQADYSFFIPTTQISESPPHEVPPRFREMEDANLPLLTDFQKSIASHIKECVERQSSASRQR